MHCRVQTDCCIVQCALLFGQCCAARTRVAAPTRLPLDHRSSPHPCGLPRTTLFNTPIPHGWTHTYLSDCFKTPLTWYVSFYIRAWNIILPLRNYSWHNILYGDSIQPLNAMYHFMRWQFSLRRWNITKQMMIIIIHSWLFLPVGTNTSPIRSQACGLSPWSSFKAGSYSSGKLKPCLKVSSI